MITNPDGDIIYTALDSDCMEAMKFLGKEGYFSNTLYNLLNKNALPDIGVLQSIEDKDVNPFYAGIYSDLDNDGFQFFMPCPEPAKKYVEFTDEDWKLFINRPIICKNPKGPSSQSNKFMITDWDKYGINTLNGDITFDFLLDNYVFVDTDEPCGKLVEEV